MFHACTRLDVACPIVGEVMVMSPTNFVHHARGPRFLSMLRENQTGPSSESCCVISADIVASWDGKLILYLGPMAQSSALSGGQQSAGEVGKVQGEVGCAVVQRGERGA